LGGGKKKDNNRVFNINSLASIVVGIVLLTIIISTSSVWLSSDWVTLPTEPPISLMCEVDVLEFYARNVISNTTGLSTTMIEIIIENSSETLFSDNLAPNTILSIGTIQWDDGSTIGFFQKGVSSGRYVITQSYMANFSKYGTREMFYFPVIQNFRSPHMLDEILIDHKLTAKMLVGFFLASGFSLVVVPIMIYLKKRFKV